MILSRTLQWLMLLSFAALAAPVGWGPVPVGVLLDTAVERAVSAGLRVDDHQIIEGPSGRVEFRRASHRDREVLGIPTDVLQGIEYDPARQDVVVHWTRVRRGDAILELKPRLHASKSEGPGYPGGVWSDRHELQDGDILDRAWSVVDRIPLRGAVTFGDAEVPFQVEQDWSRLRLVWNRSDSLHWRSPAAVQPELESVGSNRVLTWRGSAALVGADRIEWSSFGGWNGVGDWLAPWFEPSAVSGPLVAAAVAEIRSREQGEEGQILAALQRAQDLREDGMTVGGFRVAGLRPPKEPDAVLRSGKGDAADKAMVLLALLRGLGISAHPVVAARPGTFLSGRLARPSNLLDRFLVRVEVGGKTYLLQSMNPATVGGLALQASWDDARILPLGPASGGFLPAPMRTDSVPEVDLQVDVDASSFLERSKVSWKLVARGWVAAAIRQDLSLAEGIHGAKGREDMDADFTDHLADDPALDSLGRDDGISVTGEHGALVWEAFQEDWWMGRFQAQPVIRLMDNLREQARDALGFRFSATRLRGVLVVRLPDGASDQDSVHTSVARAGARCGVSKSIRDGVLRFDWEFSSPALEVEGDSLDSWLETLDSIRSLSEFTIEQDRRSAGQRIAHIAGRVQWVFAGFFALVLACGLWVHRIVWRRNPARREQVFGKAVVSTPAWWSLYPATLGLSAAWALWGLVETLPGVLGLDDGPYRSVPFLERMMEFHACSARLFVLPGFVLLFQLFRARRTSFRGLNVLYLLIASLWFLLEGWLRLGFGRIDLFRVGVMVGLFALWQFWMVYFSRSTLAPTVFRNEWTPSTDGQADPEA